MQNNIKKINNESFIIEIDQLRMLLIKSFSNGALSHSKWIYQRDTCWTNVNDDMHECVNEIIQYLNSFEDA